MKINDISQQIKTTDKLRADTGRDSRKAGKTEQPAGTDTVELSAASLEAGKIRSILAETPEVRAELVQGLKDQVERGDYHVDAHKVADKMLQNILAEDFGTNQ